jgi:hypothetical protein
MAIMVTIEKRKLAKLEDGVILISFGLPIYDFYK